MFIQHFMWFRSGVPSLSRSVFLACTVAFAAHVGGAAGAEGGQTAGARVASAAGLDACTLIGPHAAGEVLGVPVTTKTVDSAGGGGAVSMCNYSDGTASGGFMLIAARLLDAGDPVGAADDQKAQIVADTKKNIGVEPKVEDMAGLGDAAFLVDMGGTMQLHVLAGDASIVIGRNVLASAKAVQQAEALARVALGNLR